MTNPSLQDSDHAVLSAPTEPTPTRAPLRLRDGFTVGPISDRTTVLRTALVEPWTVHDLYDTEARRSAANRADAFTVHLLHGPGAGWAAVALLNQDWGNRTSRHTLVEHTLAAAHVAPTLPELGLHFLADTALQALPVLTHLPAAEARELVRADIVNLILDQYLDTTDDTTDDTSIDLSAGLDGLDLLAGLSGIVPQLRERRHQIALLEMISAACAKARFVLSLTRTTAGFRPTAHTEAFLAHAAETCVRLHFDPTTGALAPGYAEAEETVYRAHYGEQYDRVAATFPTVLNTAPVVHPRRRTAAEQSTASGTHRPGQSLGRPLPTHRAGAQS